MLGELGRYGEAIPLSRRAVELDPLNIGIRTALAELYRSNGQHELATDTLDEALKVAPDHPHVLYALGWMHYTMGQFGQAEAHIRRAIELDPGRDVWRVTLAYAVIGARGLEAGWTLLEETLAAHPGHAGVLFAMAQMQLFHGNTAAAIEYGRRALGADPNSSRSATVVATGLWMQGRLDEAEQVVRDFLAQHPETISLHMVLAEIAALRGDAGAARAAAEAEPDPDNRHYALALAAAVSGDRTATDRALAELRERCSAPDLCLADVAAIHACLGDAGRLHATLDEAEKTRPYRPYLAFPCLDRYYEDPRFIAHLAKYGMSPPARLSPPRRAH